MKKEILKKQINKGNSSRKIAESLGKSQTTVRYWLKKHNLNTILIGNGLLVFINKKTQFKNQHII